MTAEVLAVVILCRILVDSINMSVMIKLATK